MNKLSLKPGMVVETRDGVLRIFIGDSLYDIRDYRGYLILSDYNDRLYYNYSSGYTNIFDIMKVYKDSEIIYNQDIKPIWVRDETDWSKVPVDTLVEVSIHSDLRNASLRYFAKYDEETNQIICFNDGKTSKTTKHMSSWEYGRIVEMPKQEEGNYSVERLQALFEKFCTGRLCEECKYDATSDSCELGWVVDNYDVINKREE